MKVCSLIESQLQQEQARINQKNGVKTINTTEFVFLFYNNREKVQQIGFGAERGIYWGKSRRTVDYLLMSGGATVVISCVIHDNCCVIIPSPKVVIGITQKLCGLLCNTRGYSFTICLLSEILLF